MPCNAKKDLSGCVAKTKVRLLGGKHFFTVYLWREKATMNREAMEEADANAEACCCHMGERGSIPACTWWRRFVLRLLPGWLAVRLLPFEWSTPPKAGELHFCVGSWDMEIAAHECLHATIGAARAYKLDPKKVFDGSGELSSALASTPAAKALPGKLSDEEIACYIHGELVGEVYRWLWTVDPPEKLASTPV